MKVSFKVTDKYNNSNVIVIKDKICVNIGRDSKLNDVVIQSLSISRQHGTLEETKKKVWVYTDHSRHGTVIYDDKRTKLSHVHNTAIVIDDGYRLEMDSKSYIDISISGENTPPAAPFRKPKKIVDLSMEMEKISLAMPKVPTRQPLSPKANNARMSISPLNCNDRDASSSLREVSYSTGSGSGSGGSIPLKTPKKPSSPCSMRRISTMEANEVYNHPFTKAFITHPHEDYVCNDGSIMIDDYSNSNMVCPSLNII